MAEDGSGGIVYLKKEGGRNHVFAARFDNGAWSPPQRVDVGQSFDSSWARIAAGDGGRLLVTWVQEFGVGSDRMFSATLDPGATGFQEPVPVDMNVGEATSTYPDLAMNAGGQAYLTYLVITDNSSLNPPGYLGAQRTGRPLQQPPLVGVRQPGRPQPGHADAGTEANRPGRGSASTSRGRPSSPGASPTTNSSTGSGRGGSSAPPSASRSRSARRAGKARPCAAKPTPSTSTTPASARPPSPSANSRDRAAS